MCVGCVGDFNTDRIASQTISPTLSFPLINSTFTMEQFLSAADTITAISVNEEGVITINYESDPVFNQDLKSFIVFDELEAQEQLQLENEEIQALPIDFTITKTKRYEIEITTDENDELDSVFLFDGDLELHIQSMIPVSGSITFRFFSLEKDGQVAEETFDWTYNGTLPSIDITKVADLSNLKIDLTKFPGINRFVYDVEVTLEYEQEPIPPDARIEFGLKLLDFDIGSVFGRIGERPLEAVSDSIALDFFSNIEGEFSLTEPRLYLHVANSYGIPAEVTLNSLVASNGVTQLALEGVVNDPQEIAAPSITQMGDTVFTTLSISNQNSNLGDLISLAPTSLAFLFSGSISPGGPSTQNFALSSSIINLSAGLEVPLIGRASDFRATKTISFDGAKDIEQLKEAFLRFNTENGFPLSLGLQVAYFDRFGNKLGDLLPDGQLVLEGAAVDGDGNVVENSKRITEITLDEATLELLQQAESLIIEARFQTTDNGQVDIRITESQLLTIKVGIIASTELGL